ncbi:Glu/Leu/Phe/Val dehydrogenase [Erythrobacter sp. SCSIO 43205]|uniref:Leu/Phe/Val dehydrogenase n=1 Tax=Erythrobacter sp. SCSIO 43205 TaxID=2779361 RepID=UPI001CA887DB|nr:Glu/Leu/Phe/Val dehydrogenase dimerization domain-containing protein [Erythrobacter sp. SCSIO 43205]UAB76835.1 Glu/Leu/Phe/Val dehydrogenase [Erythrobacter sp. SCSIO 43205]
MTAFWTEADFDDHEFVHVVRDHASGLTAIIAVHSTHLGPGAGGTRFWHYPNPKDGLRDALRLSRGMSYKNAMAGLPAGGGKAVILADSDRRKTPEMLAAFAKAIDRLGGNYITAQDVGISEDDIVAVSRGTSHVAGLPGRGGDPGPYTARGVYLGVKAAARRALGSDDMRGVRVAIQGVGSVGGGLARYLADDGAELILADINQSYVESLAKELSAQVTSVDEILTAECDIVSPNALGAILTEESIAGLKAKAVAGGANNQLAKGHEGALLQDRGILYAPDYVINAGGIINVLREIDGSDDDAIHAKIDKIPGRLEAIWQEAEESGASPDVVADRMARRLIGR